MRTQKPKKISVRPGNNLEGDVDIVWIYHRKVQIQISFPRYSSMEDNIDEAMNAWLHAMSKL